MWKRAYPGNRSISSASGTAANPITFASYPAQRPVIDGTKLSVSGIQGLINIVNQSYVTISGFEIRNYTTANAGQTPTGIWVTGSAPACNCSTISYTTSRPPRRRPAMPSALP